jgi:hypothetical protein
VDDQRADAVAELEHDRLCADIGRVVMMVGLPIVMVMAGAVVVMVVVVHLASFPGAGGGNGPPPAQLSGDQLAGVW